MTTNDHLLETTIWYQTLQCFIFEMQLHAELLILFWLERKEKNNHDLCNFVDFYN